jgi:coenzyme F420 hydrogenase subunit beta
VDPIFERLESEVILPGLCTHCGTCVGLSGGSLVMEETEHGPLPRAVRPPAVDLPPLAIEACPGKGIHYPAINTHLFGRLPDNWLSGCYRQVCLGYSRIPAVRRGGASGGVITQTLLFLLEENLIDGAVVVVQGQPKPWQAQVVIARTADEILAASQSVYVPVPVNTILAQLDSFAGRVAYVGLPDQVASLRYLQAAGHPAAERVRYVLGPYVGTAIYFRAVESYLRSNGIRDLDQVTDLRYRAGEWPGYLQITTRSGRVLRASKFYYNYLIPFYVTRSTLLSTDFTNELTDISVGDAWHPRYEARGEGFSVVIARTEQGAHVLEAMRSRELVELEELTLDEALSMHGHMLDFKKRGAFIRLGWRAALGRPVPDWGYRPVAIPRSRKAVELIISGLFLVCGTRFARRLVEYIPLGVIGPLFDALRKAWKSISKPTKRRGLSALAYEVAPWSGGAGEKETRVAGGIEPNSSGN